MYNSIKPILKRKQILVRCTGVIWPLERDGPGVCLRVIPNSWCHGPHQESPLRWQSEGGNLGEAALYPRSTVDFVLLFLLMKTESSAAKAGLQSTLQLRMTLNFHIFLLRPPKRCNCRPVPPCLAYVVLGTKSEASCMPDKPCTN